MCTFTRTVWEVFVDAVVTLGLNQTCLAKRLAVERQRSNLVSHAVWRSCSRTTVPIAIKQGAADSCPLFQRQSGRGRKPRASTAVGFAAALHLRCSIYNADQLCLTAFCHGAWDTCKHCMCHAWGGIQVAVDAVVATAAAAAAARDLEPRPKHCHFVAT